MEIQKYISARNVLEPWTETGKIFSTIEECVV